MEIAELAVASGVHTEQAAFRRNRSCGLIPANDGSPPNSAELHARPE
jgi:hypothetical protein